MRQGVPCFFFFFSPPKLARIAEEIFFIIASSSPFAARLGLRRVSSQLNLDVGSRKAKGEII